MVVVLFTSFGTSGGFNLLHDFGTTRLSTTGPEGPLVMDAAGNLYGVSFFGGVNGVGSVYNSRLRVAAGPIRTSMISPD